jgi:hypothetical protein
MSRKKVVLKKHAVFACDPGTTTGLAWAVLDTENEAETILDLVARDLRMVSEVAVGDPGVDADWHENEWLSAQIIAKKMLDLRFRWMLAGIPYPDQHWIFEDFILYPGSHQSSRSGLSPVRMTALIHGMLIRVRPKLQYGYQSASQAKHAVPDERLKKHGLWTPGMVHGRDATRHLGTWALSNI